MARRHNCRGTGVEACSPSEANPVCHIQSETAEAAFGEIWAYVILGRVVRLALHR